MNRKGLCPGPTLRVLLRDKDRDTDDLVMVHIMVACVSETALVEIGAVVRRTHQH